MFSDFQKQCWGEAYLSPREDPHQYFANLLGCNRQEAKELCYRLIWESNLLSNVFNQVYKK